MGAQDFFRSRSESASTHLGSTRLIISVLPAFLVDGVWRSWLARTAGGREVAGSSPATPTNPSQERYFSLILDTQVCGRQKTIVYTENSFLKTLSRPLIS
jgi:hypothetical protein